MTKTISQADTNYSRLLKDFRSASQTAEVGNLIRYHEFGRLFDLFCEGLERATYGERKVDVLVEDLTAAGIFREGEDARRRLYWSRGVYRAYPDVQMVTQMGERGMTVTHLKALLGVSEALRPEAQRMLLRDGKVVPTREFVEKVQELCKQSIREGAKLAVAEHQAAKEVTFVADAETAPEETEAVAEGASTELAVPASTDAPVPEAATSASRAKEKDPVSQKPIKSLESLVIKVTSLIPDALVSVRGKTKEGFDSEPARKRFYEGLRNLRVGIRDLIEPLQVLLADLESEIGSSAEEMPRGE